MTGLEKGEMMPRKLYTSEQIIVHLREAEVELAKGQTASRGLPEVGDYGADVLSMAEGVREPARRPGETPEGLERECSLKLVADQALDLAILKEASSGNY